MANPVNETTASTAPSTASMAPVSARSALLAGAAAGFTVDISLYPLDTFKTRLQSSVGFFAAGGFRGVYKGIGSTLIGSAPSSALFFLGYESTKSACRFSGAPSNNLAVMDMFAALVGEVAACTVRVPAEVVKQRAQAGQFGGRSIDAFCSILALRHGHEASSGFVAVLRELYRGWGITILRDLPFTVLQFPLWELLKRSSPNSNNQGGLPAMESAMYGSVSGAIAGAFTTPLDVIKTRIMLGSRRTSIAHVVRETMKAHGVRAFFHGIGPRIMWISIGGFIFLGTYQGVLNSLG